VLDRLAARGVDLRPRIEVRSTMTPSDIEHRYRSPGGAIYGTSSNGKRAAFVRPANRGSRPGLYLVGGSSHPGGGLPLVTTSAKIVVEMITADQTP
jgi:phytoene dehydrogenase-like protein